MSAEKSFDVFCDTCNILVEAEVIASGFAAMSPEVIDAFGADREIHGVRYSIAICRRCSGPFLVHEDISSIPGEYETVTEPRVLFPPSSQSGVLGAPEPVVRAIEQAHRSFRTGSYDACALMCRRALEATCTACSAPAGNLAGRLAALQSQGHIDQRLLRWADSVRLIGNEAAHEGTTAVSRDNARDALELTEATILYVFTLDQRYREFQARRGGSTDSGGNGA